MKSPFTPDEQRRLNVLLEVLVKHDVRYVDNKTLERIAAQLRRVGYNTGDVGPVEMRDRLIIANDTFVMIADSLRGDKDARERVRRLAQLLRSMDD